MPPITSNRRAQVEDYCRLWKMPDFGYNPVAMRRYLMNDPHGSLEPDDAPPSPAPGVVQPPGVEDVMERYFHFDFSNIKPPSPPPPAPSPGLSLAVPAAPRAVNIIHIDFHGNIKDVLPAPTDDSDIEPPLPRPDQVRVCVSVGGSVGCFL